MLRPSLFQRHADVSPRRLFLLIAALLPLIAAGCRDGGVGPRMTRGLDEARAWSAALTRLAARTNPDEVPEHVLVSLAYLERARLGMGSPFRLAHGASLDSRLPAPVRELVAWSVLSMAVDGDINHPEWAALDSLAAGGAEGEITGEDHARLIERAILRSHDPRAGELAVRLAYRLAVAEGLMKPTATLPIGRAAALVRDRAIARRDAISLLRAADRERDAAGVLPMLRMWRATRRFAVEQPVLARTSAADEVAAISAAQSLLEDLRRLAAGDRSVLGDAIGEAPPPSFLSAELAARLADLPSVRGAPPQAPVRVAVEGLRVPLLRGSTPRERAERARFVRRALSEESLVAEYARLGNDRGRDPARATLWAAASLRAYGQEEPWQPGAGGPTVGELKARFGLASVSYDAEVPTEWRPYYNRMLASALADLERAVPGFSVKGVGIHFGRHPLRIPALAVHEPRTRTIYLPPNTAAGTIAHELAHDLDWQVAAKVMGRKGEYLTDVAVRESRGTLAARMADLTTATLAPPKPDEPSRGLPPRPTEVFARSMDWYVAASLARLGRTNGYLTAVQDELLTGYASSLPPDAAGEAAEAMVATLEEMTSVSSDLHAWYLQEYGRGREMPAYDLVRHVLDRWNAEPSSRQVPGAMPSLYAYLQPPGLASAPEPLRGGVAADPFCAAAPNEEETALTRARGRLVWLTAESVARRLLAERAREASSPLARERLSSVYQAPFDPAVTQARLDEVTREVLDRLTARRDVRLPGGTGRC